MSKTGSKALETGPETGSSRKAALGRLLEAVEGEVGRVILRDVRRKGEGADTTEGARLSGTRGDGVAEGFVRGELSSGGGGQRMRTREDVDQRYGREAVIRRDALGSDR